MDPCCNLLNLDTTRVLVLVRVGLLHVVSYFIKIQDLSPGRVMGWPTILNLVHVLHAQYLPRIQSTIVLVDLDLHTCCINGIVRNSRDLLNLVQRCVLEYSV